MAAEQQSFDLVIVGGTPGGLMAAIAAARRGKSAVVLERTRHLGGLPANGLGATDIATRGCGGGLFRQFVRRVEQHYVATYGAESEQVKLCSDGFRFEPQVAERIFGEMLAEHPSVTIRLLRQFDAEPANVTLTEGAMTAIRVLNRESGEVEVYDGKVFLDATYEGDLADAAGVPCRLGREDQREFEEPMAGRLYKLWGGAVGDGSTGRGDNAVQAYNYRLCLTNDPANLAPIKRPADYRRGDYASLVDDILHDRTTRSPDRQPYELAWDGIGRVTNMVKLPNAKHDGNNQHAAFVSTDLPEENWPWPTSSWAWRDRFADRLRDYTLGLLWFVQHDEALPEEYRRRCLEWGLAADEYQDNGHFPRQVYVREGRRIEGEHLFTAQDALPVDGGEGRPPIYTTSITASHYALDSHAVRKREPGRVHLDGFFSYPSQPYTVPYGVMVPQEVDGLLCPVPVSGTHIGFSTLRMEPCWMAMGEAAGAAAAMAIDDGLAVRDVDLTALQLHLLEQGAVLMHYRDADPSSEFWLPLQMLGLRRLVPGWEARLDEPISPDDAAVLQVEVGQSRGEAMAAAWARIRERRE